LNKDLSFYLSFTNKNNDCLEWTRCYNTDGYPRTNLQGNTNGKVHREVFKLANPNIQIEGFIIRHICDNIKCINPSHLLIGTIQDNIRDMDLRGRRFKKISDQVKEKVLELLHKNTTPTEISKLLNIDTRRISDIKMKYFKEN